ncbi:hypothetical protein AZE42_11756 [Rhizopogon vesiculosus]|uniref:DEAD/DEAH-box helicase domain-containing protein n=1 Tax=Rhizopogon vesiculosus TaxID=180088 RepID=A0A1J8R6B4_9AGAM|nr:hypothetical protein AZE42_11756 [Rhizopogon vesiculosus]
MRKRKIYHIETSNGHDLAWMANPTPCNKHRNNNTVNAAGDHEAREWQLDAAEAFLSGLNCTILAGTGFGKSLPFTMPSFMKTDDVLIILAPLNSLEEEDQARRCDKMGLSAIAVNHETYSEDVHASLLRREYQVIYTSPEMVIENLRFNGLLRS